MVTPRMTIREAEEAVRRLPITEETFWEYEALLRLPYDLFKPTLDLLAAGTISIEDLRPMSPADRARSEAGLADLQTVRTKSAAFLTTAEFQKRVEELVRSGGAPAYVAVPYDPSPAYPREDGSPGPFVGIADSVASSDFEAVTPSPTDRQEAEITGIDPRKVAQAKFRRKREP